MYKGGGVLKRKRTTGAGRVRIKHFKLTRVVRRKMELRGKCQRSLRGQFFPAREKEKDDVKFGLSRGILGTARKRVKKPDSEVHAVNAPTRMSTRGGGSFKRRVGSANTQSSRSHAGKTHSTFSRISGNEDDSKG